ncbi:EcsC family protein [Parenemella sanctibonifatiensis]|uniref:EcsC family protein n=1 Tax=Parenemella sanctibonifatiensis TaxID=2016505 RepID=A0A255DXV2_9ACTN|nr:EcsC family protein [Parenemella sanctibonifatiensis]OYN84128.1 hypothetical protein CGZ92_13890 [Parenemella sanctibonifatiensis]OYN90157.1 hypothetical protein CGZ91_08235 [Parenemella sanctibonifatiensis]
MAKVGKVVSSLVPMMAPPASGGVLRRLLDAGIGGVGPLPSAKQAAGRHLQHHAGDHDRAVATLIAQHTSLAGAQGFVTNLGGFATAIVALPANVLGLALLQVRMVAAIAHVRGYDVDEPRVRTALLMCMMTNLSALQDEDIPRSALSVATAPVFDLALDRQVSDRVAGEMAAGVGGKRLAVFASKRIPVVGGAVGLVADGWTTQRIGRTAAREFVSRRRSGQH